MKRQQSQSRIKVPNKNKVWYLKISIYLYPHQARNRKMTVGTGFQKYYCGRSLIFRNNLEEEKYCSWSKCSWIKKFLKQIFLDQKFLKQIFLDQNFPEASVPDCPYKLLFSWSKCCNSFRDVCWSSTVAAQIRDLFGGGAPTIVLVDSKPVTHLYQ